MRRGIAPFLPWSPTEHEAAYERAQGLLRDSLTPEQQAFYEEHGYLEVPSGLYEGRVYRVDGWRPVAVFEDGEFRGAICLRPREHLPGPDVVLARKLLIEGAEEEFLRAGNWLSPAWRPASAAPTILLCLIILTPWIVQLPQAGLAAVGAVGGSLLVLPLLLWWYRGRRRREASGELG